MLAALLEAAKRDVLIDVGHGSGSFEYIVCAPALARKIIPLRCGSRRFVVTRNRRSRLLAYVGPPILTSSTYLLASGLSPLS